MRSYVILAACIGMAGLMAFRTTSAQPPETPAAEDAPAAEAPKYTIEEVMEIAHDMMTGLRAKVVAGDATDEEKLKLLDAYISLTENAPPQGEADAWKVKANAVVVAMGKVVVGREGAVALLEEATSCNGCHMEFRPAPARGRRGGGRRGAGGGGLGGRRGGAGGAGGPAAPGGPGAGN